MSLLCVGHRNKPLEIRQSRGGLKLFPEKVRKKAEAAVAAAALAKDSEVSFQVKQAEMCAQFE